jgi:hypothetical protein
MVVDSPKMRRRLVVTFDRLRREDVSAARSMLNAVLGTDEDTVLTWLKDWRTYGNTGSRSLAA